MNKPVKFPPTAEMPWMEKQQRQGPKETPLQRMKLMAEAEKKRAEEAGWYANTMGKHEQGKRAGFISRKNNTDQRLVYVQERAKRTRDAILALMTDEWQKVSQIHPQMPGDLAQLSDKTIRDHCAALAAQGAIEVHRTPGKAANVYRRVPA